MSRIRTIKPAFFKNEDLAELPAIARLLFIGLWTLADREGRLEDRPKRIKAELFPYDSTNVDSEISRLQTAGFIQRYESGNLKVIQINNFTVHQRITGTEASTESDLPAPPDTIHMNNEAEGNTLENLGNNSETPWTTGKEGKGRERSNGMDSSSSLPNSNSVLKSIDQLKADCLNDQVNFVEHVRRQNKISQAQLESALETFNGFLRSGGEIVKQVKDYRFHFQSWLKKQDKTQFRVNPRKGGGNTEDVLKGLGL